MSIFFQLIKALTLHIKSQKDADDAYLSESTDVCDLERRMHELDQRSCNGSSGLSYGIP